MSDHVTMSSKSTKYILTVKVIESGWHVPGEYRVRRALKLMLRSLGIVCMEIHPVEPSAESGRLNHD